MGRVRLDDVVARCIYLPSYLITMVLSRALRAPRVLRNVRSLSSELNADRLS